MERLSAFFQEYLYDLLYLVPAILISLTVHECAHAWMATRLGDPTPRQEKRLSLNPLRHIDPIGFIVMVLAHFGWAKPVRVNPMYFENPSKGMMFTALAGPISNLCLCVVSSLLCFFSKVFTWPEYFFMFFYYLTLLNIGLAVFNLIPVAPLDGSRIVSHFYPRYATWSARHGDLIMIVFIALLVLPDFVSFIPDILGTVIGGVQSYVTGLLLQLWSLIFGFLL